MSDFIMQHTTIQTGFSGSSWVILSGIEARIKQKIEMAGTPLKDWDIEINYGIKTGLNDAFIIDELTKNELLKKSPKSVEIIRPILLGKNIKRYTFSWENKWIIFTRRGTNIEDYPAIKNYLLQFYEDLRPRNNKEPTGRKPGPYKWYEIQDNVAYFENFDKPKIAWGNLALQAQFSFIDPGYYINAPASFIATDNIFLLAILNSVVADFYIKRLGVTRNGGYFEYKPMFIEQLPVPTLSIKIQEKLITLIKQIQEKLNNIDSVERIINDTVFDLYHLSTEEREYISEIYDFDQIASAAFIDSISTADSSYNS